MSEIRWFRKYIPLVHNHQLRFLHNLDRKFNVKLKLKKMCPAECWGCTVELYIRSQQVSLATTYTILYLEHSDIYFLSRFGSWVTERFTNKILQTPIRTDIWLSKFMFKCLFLTKFLPFLPCELRIQINNRRNPFNN